jgi:hypothetical protein
MIARRALQDFWHDGHGDAEQYSAPLDQPDTGRVRNAPPAWRSAGSFTHDHQAHVQRHAGSLAGRG